MTESSRRSLPVFRATAVAAVVVSAAVFCGAIPAAAAGSGGSDPTTTTGSTGSGAESALQLQAQELAAQIQADGRQLDKMAEAYDAAQIRSAQLAGQVATLQAESALTASRAAAARQLLRQQAVLSYVVGGAPVVGSVPDSSGRDRNIALSYAEIVSGGQRRALASYEQLITTQESQGRQLAAAQHDAAVTLSSIVSDRASAIQADDARRQALSQVNGQMAVLVAQVQAQQQAAAKAAALAQQRRVTPAPATTESPTAKPAPPPLTAPTASHSSATSARAAPTTASPRTSPPPAPGSNATSTSGSTGGSSSGGYAQAPGASKAIAYAQAQLGKPYQWAGAGPNSFDCSGLTMMAWEQAGIYFPHLAQSQYNLTQPVPLSSAIPGDLIFFGTPSNVYHVGIYVGNGQMIDAPQTGQNVSVQSIYWSDLLGAGRVTTSS